MNYKAYCFDLDGTVYRGEEAIASAVAFIHYLQKQGIEPFYVTNNSSKTAQQFQQALAKIGITAPVSHIYSSALATAKYISAKHAGEPISVIGSEGLHDALARENIEVVEQGGKAVVVGIDQNLNYMAMATAAIDVQNGATLISTNQDIKFPSEYGFLPGNGSITKLIAEVAGVEPIYIGKPSPVMLAIIASEHHLEKADMVLIGDNYDTDIMCGKNFGIDTIHVNTGVTPRAIVKQKNDQPTLLVEDLTALIQY